MEPTGSGAVHADELCETTAEAMAQTQNTGAVSSRSDLIRAKDIHESLWQINTTET